MTGGRKPIPTHLRVLHGNPSQKRYPVDEPQGQGSLWAPPHWFDDRQREQWHYSLEWSPPGLLTATDREMLVVWVVACIEHARAAEEVRKLGQVVKTKDGNAIQNPYLGILNRQAIIMIRAVSELGFSPSARASLGNRGPEFIANGTQAQPRQGRLAAYLEAKPDKLPTG